MRGITWNQQGMRMEWIDIQHVSPRRGHFSLDERNWIQIMAPMIFAAHGHMISRSWLLNCPIDGHAYASLAAAGCGLRMDGE